MREEALLGTQEENGRPENKERERGRRCRRTAFQLWLWLLLFLPSRVWGEGRDTHAGFLSNAAETFMKSLQKQGRQALFLSSAAVAAVPLTSSLPALPLSVPTHCFCPIWRLIFSSAPLPSLRAMAGLGSDRTPAGY